MIINIRGTNGSGKTTLAKSFITPELLKITDDIVLPSGKKTTINFSVEGVAVVGPYDGKKTGGCDRISTKDDTIYAVEYASKLADIVIFEGIIVSTVYSTWLNFSQHIKAVMAEDFVWTYLSTPLDTCINRVYDRNGYKKINEALIVDKFKSIDRTRQKAVADGENVLELNSVEPYQHLREHLWL